MVKRVSLFILVICVFFSVVLVYFTPPIASAWINNFTKWKLKYKDYTGNLIQGLDISKIELKHSSFSVAMTAKEIKVLPDWKEILKKHMVFVHVKGSKIFFEKSDNFKISDLPGIFIDDTISRYIDAFDVFDFTCKYKLNALEISDIEGISENFLLDGFIRADFDDGTIATDLELSIKKSFCDENIGDVEGILLQGKSDDWYGTSLKIDGNYKKMLFSLSTDLIQIKINM